MTECPFACCPSGEDCDKIKTGFKEFGSGDTLIASKPKRTCAKWKAERGAIRDSMMDQADAFARGEESMTLDEMSAFEKEWEDVNESDS